MQPKDGGTGSHGNSLLRDLLGADPALQDARTEGFIAAGEYVERPGLPPQTAHFPLTCVFSVIASVPDGSEVDTLMIGRDGMSGLLELLDCPMASKTVVCRIPGMAAGLPVAILRRSASRCAPVRSILQQHAAAVLLGISRAVACVRFHEVEHRCVAWLLAWADSTGARMLPVTHETLASVLGVRRQTVTLVAESLQRRDLIEYHRGHIVLLSPEGLQELACDCQAETRSGRRREMTADQHRAPSG